jgi:hypothetical protein
MSGYITRNALMIDNPTFGPPSQSSMLPTTLANPLAAGWGTQPGGQAGTGGVDLAMPTATGGNPALIPGAPGNDDLMKALAALYGGQAQPQALTPQQQLQQAINADQASYHGREGGGLV